MPVPISGLYVATPGTPVNPVTLVPSPGTFDPEPVPPVLPPEYEQEPFRVVDIVVVVLFFLLAVYALYCFVRASARVSFSAPTPSSNPVFYALCFAFCTTRCTVLILFSSGMGMPAKLARCLDHDMYIQQLVSSVPTLLFVLAHLFLLYTWQALCHALLYWDRYLAPARRVRIMYSVLVGAFLVLFVMEEIALFATDASDGFRECHSDRLMVPASPPAKADFGQEYRGYTVVFVATLWLSIQYLVLGLLYLVVGVRLELALRAVAMEAVPSPAVQRMRWKVRFVGGINMATQLCRFFLVLSQMFPWGDFGNANPYVYHAHVFYGLLEFLPTILIIVALRAPLNVLAPAAINPPGDDYEYQSFRYAAG
eukprot:TRINITY_DN4777_c0_g1_i1.p1 TRINITY_DN4777_c0_g1~~TRINITY_DN4777_c0_g1_i1.p1  ORF type:complete len:367 (+),score=53.79 TRINITY_DN4777_c0_g1_i1:153-1253(+)